MSPPAREPASLIELVNCGRFQPGPGIEWRMPTDNVYVSRTHIFAEFAAFY
jgi:hypothetical protein